MSYYRNQLESWVRGINVKAQRVLDIGGAEKPVKDRVNSWEVEEYKILDNDGSLEVKPDYFADINADWSQLRPDELGQGWEKAPERNLFWKNDVIFCLEVFEYVYNPVQAHKNIWSCLKDGGIAYISYPTNYPLHNPVEIDYLRYTKQAIEKYLSLAGFKSWEITPRIVTAGANGLKTFWAEERMHPARNTNQVFDIGYLVKAYK